jgi:hypothetical protein
LPQRFADANPPGESSPSTSGDVDFGSGAVDPLTAGLAAALAGLALARKRRQP